MNNDLQTLKDSYMLGILATNQDSYPTLGIEQKAVTFIMNSLKGDGVVFYVKRISSDPQTYLHHQIEDGLFIGFSQSFRNFDHDLFDRLNFSTSTEEKKRIVREKLENKIIVFEPMFKYENEERKHKNLNIVDVKDIDEIEWIDNINELEDIEFKAIPNLDYSKKEFENKLFNNESIQITNYNCDEMLEPDIVLVDNILYTNLELGWEKEKSKNHNSLKYIKDTIGRLYSPDNFDRNVIYKYKNLSFISDEYYRELNDNSEEFDKEKLEELYNNIEVEKMSDKLSVEENKNYTEYNERENQFLKALYENALRKKLYYDKEDLYNLHTSIKTSPLTIISGMSGTGKTRMAQLYAETLGLNDGKEYIILPISPSYTEPDDVLGYLNTINGIYTPSETGLVDILIEANKNKNKIYMVIFDEMNLSQVEHWFSPFISLLELDEKDRKLQLYNKNSICHNKYYPSYVPLGNNLIFIGTVNIDETTKDFSDRLLDRVNVVNPKKLGFYEIKSKIENNQLQESEDKVRTYKGLSSFGNWRKKVGNPIEFLKTEELQLLDELHTKIHEVDAQKGVSFRIIKNIAKYLKNIPIREDGEMFISRDNAFDIQVKQRILTKLAGHQEQYGRLIGEFKNNEIQGSEIYEILKSDKAKTVSDFKYTIKELKRKAKEMYFNGYAL